MKIGVITLHRVRNYGSSLQTLATQRFLEQNGCEAEIIDYYPERYTSRGLLKRLKNKSDTLARHPLLLLAARMIISVSYLRKKIVFDKFLKRHLHCTAQTFRTEAELKAACPPADAYCTGSDQVWNSHWNEGVDAPFYLSFPDDSCYRFSFASSIGNVRLSGEEAAAVTPMLAKYRHISVREDKGVEVIEALGLQAVQLLDPTLLFPAAQWKAFVSRRYRGKRYVVTYNLHHDKRIDDYANALAAKHGLSVFHISYNLHDIIRKGSLKWCPAIEDYLGLIHDAAYVVTDSFHATVFSVLFHKQLVVIYPEEASSRIRSILSLLQMQDRGFEELPDTAAADAPIDFDRAEAILSREREASQVYLNTIIDELHGEGIA
ncbi:MAG: polysaccharide pyruvyl transferase family protein [Ruminococcus sp.]|nr:polysaccharide pyruvyl transferase family protein [Ruminococcus sp.]